MRMLGDLYSFHVGKGALITDHADNKWHITFHGCTLNYDSRRRNM